MMKLSRIGLAAAVVVGLVGLAVPPSSAGARNRTELVSADNSGATVTGDSFGADVSASGRYVAFTAVGPLSADDTNGVEDVYVRDRVARVTRRVSADSEAPPSFAGINPAISDDGQVIAYIGHHATPSGAAAEAVFVRDLRRGTLTRISPDDVSSCWSGGREGPTISGDGTTVVFACSDGATPPPGATPCFAVRLATGARRPLPECGVSLTLDRKGRFLLVRFFSERIRVLDIESGAVDDVGSGIDASMSGDGQVVAFSTIDALLSTDTNNRYDIYVIDRTTRLLRRASVSSHGVQGDQHSFSPNLSADGRFVGFESFATTLVTPATDDVQHIFLHDRATGRTERVDAATTVTPPIGRAAFDASVSAHARVVTFTATVPLLPKDTNDAFDVYALER